MKIMEQTDNVIEVLRQYTFSDDFDKRLEAARNHRTPEDCLWKLAHENDETIWLTLASNFNIPEKIVDFLIATKNKEVVIELCGTYFSSSTIYNKIVDAAIDYNIHKSNLKILGSQIHTTPAHIEKLLQTVNPFDKKNSWDIMSIVNETDNPDILQWFTTYSNGRYARDVAENTNISEKTRNQLLQHTNSEIAATTLVNNCRDGIPEILPQVVSNATYNENMTKYLLTVKDIDPDLVEFYVNKFSSSFVKKDWMMYSRCANANPERLHSILMDRVLPFEHTAKNFVTKNFNTLTKTLDFLFDDEDDSVRKNVAEHPNTSKKILNKLAFDENIWVQISALETFRCSKKTVRKIVENFDDEELLAYALAYRPFFPEYKDWPEEWIASKHGVSVEYYVGLKKMETGG